MAATTVVDVLKGLAGFVLVPVAADVLVHVSNGIAPPSSPKAMAARYAIAHGSLGALAFYGRKKTRDWRPFLTGGVISEGIATAYAAALFGGAIKQTEQMGPVAGRANTILGQKGAVRALLSQAGVSV